MLCKTNLSTGLKGQRQTRREALTISVLRLVMGTSLIRLTYRESETRFFYEKTWFVLEDEVKNLVSLVCVRPGLTDRVISGEELLIDKLNLMC